MSAIAARAPREAPEYGRHLPRAVIALGLLPSVWAAWLLWFAPLDDLTADRTALAARDFTALWTAGRIASEHAFATLSDPASFTVYLRSLFGPGMPAQIWPYPPVVLLLARPFAALPLGSSFVLYTALSLLALTLTLRSNGFSTATIAAVLLSPAVATNALAGQNGTLMATLLIGALLMIDHRPIVAGLLLGGLCLKPQFAVLLPICLLASGKRQTMLAGCISVVILAFLSFCVFGHEPWVEFLARNREVVSDYVGAPWQAAPAQAIFSSAFMAARSIGASLTASYLIQFITTFGCAYSAWRLWSRTDGVVDRHRTAATIALVLLASPWVHTYDMPALAIAVALTFQDFRGVKRALLGFAWLWPGLSSMASVAPVITVLSVGSVAWLTVSVSTSSSSA